MIDKEKITPSGRPSLPKRFYKDVSIARQEDGFAVFLDGKPVKTPAQHSLLLPVEALANLIADEFRLQDELIDPAKMPITRLANTVLDGIAADPQPVLEDILRFAANDMLFYRAENPKELVARQAEHWDAVLDWVEVHIGARFVTGEGVMYIEQPREAIAAISAYLRQYASPFAIAALHAITILTGSALLALAIAAGKLDVAAGWRLAHLDEDWTIEHWGADEEAAIRRGNRENELYTAAAVLAASRF